jgi:mannose-6-phosphate isomerase-like protein (cupin superfamily)
MRIVRSGQVPATGFAKAFAGEAYGIGVSFLIIEAKSGEGPATHSHSYPEVIIIQRGQARCVVGDVECVADAGDVIFIAANEPHSFTNSGDEPLMQIDIHLSERFATQWLDSGYTSVALPCKAHALPTMAHQET